MKDITIEGKIVSVNDGETRINKGYTHGWMSLRVKVGRSFYSVSFATRKFNTFGFIPKAGHWVRVTGKLILPKDDYYDPSIKHVSKLEHIEEPKPTLADQIMMRLKINN